MAKLNLEIQGVDKLIKKFKKLGERGERIAGIVTEATAREIEADAKRLAPYDKGHLRRLISSHKITLLSWGIVAAAKYSAYMEFGTGGLVEIPPELKALAAQFKGKGIRKVNLLPQPFLYPALVINKINYIHRLKEELKKIDK